MSSLMLSGATRRVFPFPASLPETFAYYRDIERSLGYLPYIKIVQKFSPEQYRLLYSAKESASYRVNIFCDVLAVAEPEDYRIRILPLPGKQPVKSTVHLNEMTCQGYYTSKIR